MDKFDRIQILHRIFTSRRLPVPITTLTDELECSERTVHRLIETMQNILQAPLEYDPSRRGWHYQDDPDNRFELPGLWLTGGELQSLSLLLNLLENLGSGLLNDEISVIEKEVHKLLKARGISPSAFAERIKILPIANRQMPGKIFNKVGEALLKRRRLHIHYTDFSGKHSERDISPQTLIHYRDNWFLDAWCHRRNDLRSFAIARITQVEALSAAADQIDKVKLREHFATSYGIFAGQARHSARLRFDAVIARDIAIQQWHPNQQGEWQGRDYLLTIPYADDRELIQDILRHCPHVTVEEPVELREKVAGRLREALARFASA
jgi:proteasome accessory factor C